MSLDLKISFLLLYGMSVLPLANATQVITGVDPEAQLPFWELRNPDMSLRLVQRLPDQTRAFFQARGFTPEHAERIAQSCVFQTVFKNTSSQTTSSALEYNLREWKVFHRGTPGRMKTREDWQQEWEQHEVALAAQLAFEWALYPTWQRYQPGDYNWGMSIFNLQPGSVFDLEVIWQQGGRRHTARIGNIQCAEDVYLAPRSAE